MANTGATANNDTKKMDDDLAVDVEISYVATVFDNVNDAKSAYKELTSLQREGLVNIIDAAYVEKTDRSKVKVHDHNDWAIGEGVLGGGVTGALIGIIAGTILLPAAIGALIGGIVMGAYEYDSSFSNKDLKNLGDSLQVGSSALVAIVEDVYVEEVEVEMKKQGGGKVHSGKIPKSTADSVSTAKAKK